MEPRLLCFCDTPTVSTGFGRVMEELLKRWRTYFADIDIHGINYDGAPHTLPYRIWRTGFPWYDAPPLQRFMNAASNPVVGRKDKAGDKFYTHIFLLQDAWALSGGGLPAALAELRRIRNGERYRAAGVPPLKVMAYFPCDAPFRAEWMEIARVADVAVTYTEYGKAQAERWISDREIEVIPHGVDANVFTPMAESRSMIRQAAFDPKICNWGGFDCADDFLMLNVNMNQRRKGIAQSFAILKNLKEQSELDAQVGGERRLPKFKLLLHMAAENRDEGVELEPMAEQFGLVRGEDWQHTGKLFNGLIGSLDNAALNALYNAADLYLTTSLGEGWGMGITEALAAGTPVAAPRHTACAEILKRVREDNDSRTPPRKRGEYPEGGTPALLLPLSDVPVVNTLDFSQVRYPVDVEVAAQMIMANWDRLRAWRQPLSPAIREWLNWDRIAARWLELMGVGETIEVRAGRANEAVEAAFAKSAATQGDGSNIIPLRP